MKKNLLATFLLSILAMAASAADKYEINIAGTEVTSDNCNHISFSTDNDIESGYAVYDASTNTLTCYSLRIRRSGSGKYGIHNRKCNNLTIVFKGICQVATTDHALNLARSTILVADAGSQLNVYAEGNGHGLNLGSYNYYINGTGYMHLNGKNSIHGNGSGSTTVYFQGAEVYTKSDFSGYQNHSLESFKAVFNEGADLTIYDNGLTTSVNNVSMYFYGKETVLSPYGAYYSNGAIYSSSGSQITSQDIYISDRYVAKLSSDYFPDANFRYYLSTQFPKGYITAADVYATEILNASSEYITTLQGLEYFTRLVNFDCSENNLTWLPSLPNTLEILRCRKNRLTSLPNLPSGLTLLQCDNNQLTALPTMPASLQTLECENNKLSGSVSLSHLSELNTLNISNNPSMTILDCSESSLTTLNVSGCTALTNLLCGRNQLTSLDVGSLNNLLQLECARNKLTSINVSSKTKLKMLNVCKNQLTSINVQGCSAMEELNCYDNMLSSVSVQGCSSLKHINISLNQIKESAMGNLVNNLRTIPAGITGELDVYYENDAREGNVITTAQVKAARNKHWFPKKNVNGSWFNIPVAIPGDVNGDGFVTSADVTAIYDVMLGTDLTFQSTADVNGDGYVTSADVTMVYDIMLGI